MPVATLAVGIGLLLFGRRLFWLFLAGTGFLAGAWLSVEFLGGQSDAVQLGAAVALGVVGALVAFKAQKIAVGLGGFLAGAYLAHALQGATAFAGPAWVPVVVGGIVGALLLAALFNWALIALSSLLGAAVVAQNAPIPPPWPVVAFVVLLALGLAIQTRQFRGKKSSKEKKD